MRQILELQLVGKPGGDIVPVEIVPDFLLLADFSVAASIFGVNVEFLPLELEGDPAAVLSHRESCHSSLEDMQSGIVPDIHHSVAEALVEKGVVGARDNAQLLGPHGLGSP